jgi:ABC-type bacteriocin/lantibiotic exporter with double-glycine peptidase domain
MKNISGLKNALLKIFAYSVVVEAINLLLPIGTQLVTDHVIIAHDESLLAVICIGLVMFTLFHVHQHVTRMDLINIKHLNQYSMENYAI